MTGGHVFVVNGRLESVDADLVVIPTDELFTVTDGWAQLWGGNPSLKPTKPVAWKRGSAARLPTEPTPGIPQLCFIDAARSGGESANRTIDKIVDGVSRIIRSARVLAPGGHGRIKPLVAIPTLGVQGGGLGGVRGNLIAKLLFSRASTTFTAQIVAAIGNPSRAGLSHLLLANLGCKEVVTTNFDLLYELGAQTGPGHPVAVLPQHSPGAGQAWLLKMHGDINDEKSIILSRRDFIGYDSSHGPAGAMFQSLLLSHHLLVVGASMTDDNFLRLAYEVEGFLKVRNAEPRVLGTVVTHEPQLARKRLFAGIFEYVDASGGTGGADGARALAIFLDLVAHRASEKSSFLLDPAYRDLLPEADRGLADDLQPLIARIAAKGSAGGPWRELDEKLQLLGAKPHRP